MCVCVCVCVCVRIYVFGYHFFINTYFIGQYRHILPPHFLYRSFPVAVLILWYQVGIGC